MISRILLTIAASLTLVASGYAKAKPGVDVVQAAKLASDYLKGLGADAPHIVSITLDEGAVFASKPTWVVRWSKSISAEGATEVGLRVKGDGSIVRLVEAKGTRSKRSPAALDIR